MNQFYTYKTDPKLDPFNALGHEVPASVKLAGYDFLKSLGLTSADSFNTVNKVSEQIKRDNPYKAQQEALKYIDLTAWYRLFSILLVGSQQYYVEHSN